VSLLRWKVPGIIDVDFWRLLTSCDELLFGFFLPGPERGRPDDAQLKQIRLSLWRLRRAFQRLTGPAEQQALLELADVLTPNLEQLRHDLTVWLDFIEQLIQGAERSLGPQPGQGARKAQLVKGALLYWIRKNKVDIPGVPAFFEPFLANVVLDVLISSIVQLANKQDLWALDAPALPTTPRRAQALDWVARLLQTVTRWLEDWAWWVVMRQNPVDVHVKAAIDTLGPEAVQVLVRTVRVNLQLLAWAVEHRRVLADLVDLVTLAVNETQGFLHMTGPQKRVYARRYLLEFLIQEGVVARDGILRLLVEQFLDVTIDGVVHLIKKRDGFEKAPLALEGLA
jgi:hypothetical protein